MRKIRALAALVLLSFLSFGWAPAEAGEGAKPARNAAQAYGRFVEVRRRVRPIDFKVLTGIYESELAAYVRETDERYGTGLDAIVRDALAKGRAGQGIFAHAQIGEKSIQRAFILTFCRSLRQLREEGEGHDDGLRRLLAAAPVLRSTAERRSRWVESGAGYPDLFDAAMEQLQRAAMRKNSASLTEAGAQLEALVTKVLVLSVFYELGGLEKARGEDADKAAEKREEARIYHLSLMPEHRRRDEDGAVGAARELAASVERIDIGLVRGLLKNAFQWEVADVDPSLLGLARR